jgi:hypothetical protein
MASKKRPLQFTLMQLIWAVTISAVIFSVPPFLWLFGLAMTIMLLAWSIFAGLVLVLMLGPALVYWKLVHSVESRRPDWVLSDVVFSIGGTVCFFLGIGIFIAVITLLIDL